MDGNSINAGGNAAQSWWVDGGAAAQIFPTDLSAFQTKLAGPVTTDASTGIRGGRVVQGVTCDNCWCRVRMRPRLPHKTLFLWCS